MTEKENRELEALRLVAQEAREIVGQYDESGEIDRASVEALRALLWRASIKTGQQVPR